LSFSINYNLERNGEKEIKEILLRQNDSQIAYQEIRFLCVEHLSKLRVKVISQGFLNQKDEIHFFKVTKQAPLYNFIYYSELLIFESLYPKSNIKYQKKYIKTKSKELKSWLHKHEKFIQYTKLNQNHLDQYYFTRKYQDKMNLSHYSMDRICDLKFNTSHDTVLAKLKAYELLVEYMSNRLSNIKAPSNLKEFSLKWTSSKVSLTELIYGLYQSNAINNGAADIKQIANTMQKAFNCDLGNVYRSYTEIRSRKKSRTKFLDEISFALSNRMEIDDG